MWPRVFALGIFILWRVGDSIELLRLAPSYAPSCKSNRVTTCCLEGAQQFSSVPVTAKLAKLPEELPLLLLQLEEERAVRVDLVPQVVERLRRQARL